MVDRIISKWERSQSKILIFIEPGTKYGFENIKYIRDKILKKNLKIAAPCPNILPCPMNKNDWCHFYVRVKRTKYHKYIKAASLGYEDEKFSYLIISKESSIPYQSRAIRFTKKSKDEIFLTLCKSGNILTEKILRSDGKNFKIAKKTDWGDIFNEI